MPSFLARCCLVALLLTGFAFTGDIGRLSRGLGRLIGSSDIPRAERSATDPGAEPAVAGPTATADAPQPTASLIPLGRFDVDDHPDPLASRPIDAPPTDSLAAIEIATLPPGARIHVWIGQGGRWTRRRAVEVIRLDVIDPAVGEVLEYRHCATTAGSDASSLPPRRMRLSGGVIRRDNDLTRLPVGRLHEHADGSGEERTGPVVAIAVGSS